MIRCASRDNYLFLHSHLTTDVNFESGFIKLQEGDANSLPYPEKLAVKALKMNMEINVADGDSDAEDSMAKALKKCKKVD